MSTWVTGGWSPASGAPVLTLVEGATFCISDLAGDIQPGTTQGLFDRDTRFLSRWELMIGGEPTEALEAVAPTPFSADLLARIRPHKSGDSSLLVWRHRYIGSGMREDLVLRNVGLDEVSTSVVFAVDSDFAHIFEVKDDRVVARGSVEAKGSGGDLHLTFSWYDVHRGVIVRACDPRATVGERSVIIPALVPPKGEWRTCVEVIPTMDGARAPLRHRCGDPVERALPARQLAQWRRSAPSISSGHDGLNQAVKRSEDDLGALRIFDSEFPERAVVAAGAPWFMTLFGRDSLLTSWMTLLVDPGLAVGTLRTLARYQGKKVDPMSEEEPGRIPHELRTGSERSLAHGQTGIYYGTVDATPLFVILLGELRRWGLGDSLVADLLPHADRALEWIEEFGDRDGDGFVEYQRATERGLRNQGWKDSEDGISYADGRLPDGPIALCEVQGYVYGAYLARAHFAREAGDRETQARYATKARRLKAAFNEMFWMSQEGFFAVGLDGKKHPIDSVTSNVGHCLWTGIVDEEKAAAVAERLTADDMLSGFGVRTLASTMGAYNPVSYHNGSIWPHDSALVAAGLMRYGFVEAAQQIMVGLLDAVESFGGRFPELFCGFERGEFPAPVGYPTACSPQAWASATPYLLVRTMLRFDPWIPRLALWLAPAVPEAVGSIAVERIPLARNRISVHVNDEVVTSGVPKDVEIIAVPRRPGSALF